jgi:DNA-binding Lrp family transcriptional regulator
LKEIGKSDELDLDLINAMQIAPRAPWKLIADVIGTSPITAARRWEQLQATGLAWVTVCGSSQLMERTSLAVVAINCESSCLQATAAALLDDPCTVTISHTSGDCDLLIIVWTRDLTTLSRYVVERLNALPGTSAVWISTASEIYADGSRWRLQALDSDQRRRLVETIGPSDSRAEFRFEDRQLMVALSHNGRASYKELGAQVGTSPATVRRRLARLLGDGAYTARCEVSRRISGSPIEITIWLEAPVATVRSVGEQLAQLPEARLCAAVVGGSNIVLVVWLRSVGDLQALEQEIAHRTPASRVVKRALTLRHLKLITRVMEDELADRVVPADIWR